MEPGINAEFFSLLDRARKAYSRCLEPVCRKQGLTRNEVDVLLFLYNNPGFDRAADIVSRRGIAKSHVSLAVTALEEAGLLEKSASREDRRAVRLTLTPSGQQVAREAREYQLSFFQALYRGISREELEVEASVTRQVWRNLEKLEDA